ncbi:uncharacterized protein LAJ45_02319 [Morchella importuna]|uniref:uncharacterized protein n=1 Tax=Morchella importuna TaxID=1174673 RepID=UPI001E8CF5BD|nr:uncharacterized protein LAJ45_02319 [Morchella importuna]KAH8153506.1 hypothetical protein LAJ45_02319 [Morchella importuna]
MLSSWMDRIAVGLYVVVVTSSFRREALLGGRKIKTTRDPLERNWVNYGGAECMCIAGCRTTWAEIFGEDFPWQSERK